MRLHPAGSKLAELHSAALLVVASAALVLMNLRHSLLWQDEAQTAVISRTVLANGLPLGTDGRNFFSQESGAEYGPRGVWRWHTWLPFYVLAGFFRVFGECTFVARLPFALCGIATVVATHALGSALWRDRRAAMSAGVFLTLSVPFLILARQCRWYSMAALFVTLALLGYVKLVEGRRLAVVWLAGAIVLLFHTHYAYAGMLLPGLVAHALGWHRSRLKRLAAALAAAALLCLPWVPWLAAIPYGRQYGARVLVPWVAWTNLVSFVAQLETHVIPLVFLEVPVLLLGIRVIRRTAGDCFARELWDKLSLLLLVLTTSTIALALVAPAPFFRYLAPLIPIIMLLAGRLTAALLRWHWIAGAVFAAAFVGTNPLREYAYELTHDFDGPMEGIIPYLNAHGADGHVAAITYGDMPLKFYTRLRVVGGLTGEDLAAAQQPDWIIIRRHAGDADKERPVREFLQEQLRRGRYEPIALDFPDTPWENREDPALHMFRSAKLDARVTIWRRVRTE